MVDLKQQILDHLNVHKGCWELNRTCITDIQVVRVFGNSPKFDQWREEHGIKQKRITGGWELTKER